MKKEFLNKIKKEIDSLISNIVNNSFSTEINFNKETNTIEVQINSEDPSTLIGHHGETMNSLQLIFAFIVHKITGNWIKVLANINDYRQKKEEQLKNLAFNLATKVKFTGEPQILENFSPSERRIIHLALVNHPDVYTQSEGEGKERKLIIKPKSLS